MGFDHRASGGKKVSAVRVWESAELRPSPVMVWTPAQRGAFLDTAAGHRLYALFHVMAFRRLRRGEGCGVRWEDLNTEEQTLVVAKQLVQIGWDFEEGDPKTEASDGWWLWARAQCSYCKSTGCGRTLSAWSGGRRGRTPAASSP